MGGGWVPMGAPTVTGIGVLLWAMAGPELLLTTVGITCWRREGGKGGRGLRLYRWPVFCCKKESERDIE